MMSFPVLRSKRLVLRQLEFQDANEIFQLRSNEAVNKYLDRPKAETIDDAMGFIKKIKDGIDENKSFYWAICLRGELKLSGTICVWNINENKAEIGYELLPEYQGKGFMQEALETVLDYAFHQIHLNKILAVFHPDNRASVRLLERNNFSLSMDSEDMVENMIVYKLERAERNET